MSDAELIAALRAGDEAAFEELVEVITDYLEGALPERDQFKRTVEAVGVVREQDLDPEVRAGLMEAFRGWSGSNAS